MKFYFPDSQDQISPSFDFETEKHAPFRVRQRDDLYAHEALAAPAYGGMLVSKAVIDGVDGESSGRYSMAHRHRFYRVGVRGFFRLDSPELTGPRISTIGDCGAFTYVKEKTPPYSVDEVIEYYECGRFDIGVSIDHMILHFDLEADLLSGLANVSAEWKERQELTLQLADEFLAGHKKRNCSFTPMGVAQGWSPLSYARSVKELQKMGYSRIGLGGMVPMKTPEIIASLKAVDDVRQPDTQLHLFGVTRVEALETFQNFGVTSFDSTSPFLRAFKDDRKNYFTQDTAYVAIRIPQVEGNPKLGRRIKSGEVSQKDALQLERRCRDLMATFDAGGVGVDAVLDALSDYEAFCEGTVKRREAYRRTLEAAPWKTCPCKVCRESGHHVILFRGAERNKRRGFHNLFAFNQKFQAERQEVQVRADARLSTTPTQTALAEV